MIVAKSFHNRYGLTGSQSRGFMASMGSTELTQQCKVKLRSRTASRKAKTKESLLSKPRETPLNDSRPPVTLDKGYCKSASTISTCLRSTSKRPTNQSFHPNSTVQSKQTVDSKYSSRKHNRLGSEAASKTTKKRHQKTHTQHSRHEDQLMQPNELQLVYDRVGNLLERHKQRESQWQRDRKLYEKTIELLVGQLTNHQHKHTKH